MKIFCFLLFLMTSVFGGSLKLYNDTPYKLRVMIRGADGSFLGEMVLNPEHNGNWSDSYGHTGQFGKGTLYKEGVTRSQTPYTVLWYCIEGAPYSYNDTVPTGGLASARGGIGAHMCNPNAQDSGAYPQQQKGEYLAPKIDERTKDKNPQKKLLPRYPEQEIEKKNS